MRLKSDQPVMCIVKSIEGTTVFLEIENGEKGSMLMSEVAAGRIRNLREYVFPNKRVVCKILKVLADHYELSLRRVTAKERDEVLDRIKKEQTLLSMLRSIMPNPQESLEKIKEVYSIPEFIELAKQDKKIISQFLDKEKTEKLYSILSIEKDTKKEVKKTIILNSNSDEGLDEIKSILSNLSPKITYLGSSQFSISAESKDFKSANSIIQDALKEIESRAKAKKAILEIKEK